ncbi:RluA family pseudouridine synthase [Sphingosinicella soli]|uniref:Pseudouridine synthase n=1 Tax=Sphingosinicella soli TaxID=333708 RepID=A0A7W7B2L8_9SPHN|nr:RluA family pseudouridine synthase [Sphingosinicella soli]MBB4632889.1 23S rRNA pseudouridine1911/1915/1917 synthase [Sphingosinicella soli]
MNGGKSNISIVLSDAAAGQRLDRALADALPGLSRERLKALMLEGAVTVAGKRPTPSLKVAGGEQVCVTVPEAAPATAEPQAIPLSIVHEDDDLIVLDKPAGLVVHPAAGNLDGTLVNALLHHCAGRLSGIGGVARPGIVHRIDKDTSGLLVIAKTDLAHEGLAKQFAAHSIGRRYLAVVAGRPSPLAGRIEGAIGRHPVHRKKMDIVSPGKGKHAVTHYRTLAPLKDAALVECRLETGRTHQVRVHLASSGHALLGDPLYGRARATHRDILKSLGFGRQALHARSLQFVHPRTQENLAFESPVPSDIQELIEALAV